MATYDLTTDNANLQIISPQVRSGLVRVSLEFSDAPYYDLMMLCFEVIKKF